MIGFEPNYPDFLLANFNAMNNYRNIRIHNAFVGDEVRSLVPRDLFQIAGRLPLETTGSYDAPVRMEPSPALSPSRPAA